MATLSPFLIPLSNSMLATLLAFSSKTAQVISLRYARFSVGHTNFAFERLEYLQDTVLGIINLDQNQIMKTFTFVSLLLMPATLLTSFYGMNVELPLAQKPWAWIMTILMMVLMVLGVWFFFKRKKML